MTNHTAAIAKAALAWYVADEQLRIAAARKRRATDAARGCLSFSPQGNAERWAYEALDHARKGEQQARRTLKKACAATKPLVIDVTATTPIPILPFEEAIA